MQSRGEALSTVECFSERKIEYCLSELATQRSRVTFAGDVDVVVVKGWDGEQKQAEVKKMEREQAWESSQAL